VFGHFGPQVAKRDEGKISAFFIRMITSGAPDPGNSVQRSKPFGRGGKFGAHGLRLSDQTSVETAVTRTAMAAMAGGSRINMSSSDSIERPYVHDLFYVGQPDAAQYENAFDLSLLARKIGA
jgi:hypothetical protein